MIIHISLDCKIAPDFELFVAFERSSYSKLSKYFDLVTFRYRSEGQRSKAWHSSRTYRHSIEPDRCTFPNDLTLLLSNSSRVSAASVFSRVGMVGRGTVKQRYAHPVLHCERGEGARRGGGRGRGARPRTGRSGCH